MQRKQLVLVEDGPDLRITKKPAMSFVAQAVFGLVNWAARNGLAESSVAPSRTLESGRKARRTGVRGETYAYWYLRRLGYVMIARNYVVRGTKGEIDLVGYDGETLAFVEVKTRTGDRTDFGAPEDAVTFDKKRLLSRMTREFLREYKAAGAPFRFDVLAIDSRAGQRPAVRLHKGAFAAQ
jgi:putative endonuclease